MSILKKRIGKLEGGANRDAVVVLLHSWLGDGEYHGLCHGNKLIRRMAAETEEAFIDRAQEELVKLFPAVPVLTCFAIRLSDLEAA